jgi:hypothetical protein
MKYLRKFSYVDDVEMTLLPNVVLINSTGKVKYNVDSRVGEVKIQHINGSLFTVNEWVERGFSNDQANGVAVSCKFANFVIAKEDISEEKYWSSVKNVDLDGVLSSNDKETARTDYAGKANTDIIAASDISEAAYCCVNYEFPNGQKGYLPSAGEWTIVQKNITAIKNAMAVIGGTAFVNGDYYWSSTECATPGSAWVLRPTSTRGLESLSKGSRNYVRPFTTL